MMRTEHSVKWAKKILTEEFDLVERTMKRVASRHRLSFEEREEFVSSAWLKLVDNEYAALRKFKGTGTLRAYLATVFKRHLLDLRVRKWGKWRPSAAARRLGSIGIEMDRLLHRRRLRPREAVETLKVNLGVELSRGELLEIASQLPARQRPVFEGGDALQACQQADGGEKSVWLRLNRPRRRKRALALALAVNELPEDDRKLLSMRYREGLTVRRIAEKLGVSARPLYTRFERISGKVRCRLSRCGAGEISREDFQQLARMLCWEGDELRAEWAGSARCPGMLPASRRKHPPV